MPEPDIIPISASIASTGKGIRYIGNWIYAMSGAVSVDNSQITMNSFTTGSGLIVCKWTPGYAAESTDNMIFRVSFNAIQVYRVTLDGRLVNSPFQWVELIIPPETTVLVNCEDKTGAGPIQMSSNFTGRVYGAV
jgi:hypothetical protein